MLPLSPPIDPMLAKLSEEMPDGPGWRYEPKWDGFRAIAFRDGDDIHVQSRDRKPLERYFPEIVPVLARGLPERCVLDGEIVIGGDDGLDFDALLLRIHPAESRIRKLAAETPSSMVAFDLLALGDDDLRLRPLSERRATLEKMLSATRGVEAVVPSRDSQLMLTPQTEDRDVALAWFDELEHAGLDGIVAKRADGPYVPGQRAMVKVKHRRTADCIVIGYRLSKTGDGVGSLLLGLYDEGGTLHYVGHTSSFKTQERRQLLEQLQPLVDAESFVGGRSPGGPSRWTGGRDLNWVSLRPSLVCEVQFDHLQGNRFRHAARFLRWRTDRDPRSCGFQQIARR